MANTHGQDLSTPLNGWAERRRARAEEAVDVAEIRLDASERAVVAALGHPEMDEVDVLGVVVPRQASTDVLAMAQSDLSRARRRFAGGCTSSRRRG